MEKHAKILLYVKPFDWILFLISIGIATYSAFSLSTVAKPAYVVIENAADSWVYPLEEEQTVQVVGPLGITTIRIEKESVSFVDSPCPHKTCIAGGAISSSNEWAACLPNSVFAYIEAREAEDGVDAVSN